MIEKLITGWIVSCHSKWCDGPEDFKYIDGKEPPVEPIPCPVCGWPALRDSGIRAIEENLEED